MKNNKNNIFKNAGRPKLWIFHHLLHLHHFLIHKIESQWINSIQEPILWTKSKTTNYNSNT